MNYYYIVHLKLINIVHQLYLNLKKILKNTPLCWGDICTRMFIAGLSTAAKTWKQPKLSING